MSTSHYLQHELYLFYVRGIKEVKAASHTKGAKVTYKDTKNYFVLSFIFCK